MEHAHPDQDFSVEIDCVYKEEKYSVRNNGAVFRHPRSINRLRSSDNQWTFGKQNDKNGYMYIASVPVHRIVATAFHEVPGDQEYIVDHIDTNKQNNRSENLRWVTRLENILLNPITAKRIIKVCGSVEAFLADPAKFWDKFQEPNYSWMRPVSAAEAKASLDRLLLWAKSDKDGAGGTIDEWIFNHRFYSPTQAAISQEPELIMSQTPNAVQRNWRTRSQFPCCPQLYGEDPVSEYASNLHTGAIFCRNDFNSHLVIKRVIVGKDHKLLVLSKTGPGENAVKPWALAEIVFENGLFIHSAVQTFLSAQGGEKAYCLAQGLEWSEGDTIDDFS